MKSATEDRTQRVLKALSSPVRREILWRLWNGECQAGAIAAELPVSAPTVSEHLSVLRAVGLVEVRREGPVRWYRARKEIVARYRTFLGDDSKWADGLAFPEQALAQGALRNIVAVTARAPCSQAYAFRAFTEPALYTAWLGAPVTIEDGRFSCTLDFGPTVRGAYLHLQPPALIVMEWDFETFNVPAPGRARQAELIILPEVENFCRLNLRQFIEDPSQAAYMELAWRFVLGRFVERGAAGPKPR